MCCLFGVLDYSGQVNNNMDDLINALAQHATERGMDSTGIAYNKDGVMKIYKKPLSAWEMNFKGLENSVCVTGHTRHTTQGSETKNYNNHPFMGYCDNAKFALAHNGVLWNDKTLRTTYGITANKIETDSYIAVQLLEYLGTLNSANIREMCESINGSYAFSMVDTHDNLWLVKGDSPLSIVHLPKQKMYVYASTSEILFGALSETNYVEDIVARDFDIVPIHCGDILCITKHGAIVHDTFTYSYTSYTYDWRSYGVDNKATTKDSTTIVPFNVADTMDEYDKQYLVELKRVAAFYGITGDEIDELLGAGYTLDEVEDYVYDIESYTRIS